VFGVSYFREMCFMKTVLVARRDQRNVRL